MLHPQEGFMKRGKFEQFGARGSRNPTLLPQRKGGGVRNLNG